MPKHMAHIGNFTIRVETGRRLNEEDRSAFFANVSWKHDSGRIEMLPLMPEIRKAAEIFVNDEAQFAGLSFNEYINGMFDDQSFR